jgi:hypothetical protein
MTARRSWAGSRRVCRRSNLECVGEGGLETWERLVRHIAHSHDPKIRKAPPALLFL